MDLKVEKRGRYKGRTGHPLLKHAFSNTTCGRLESKQNVLIKLKHLDVSVSLVDCCKDATTTTTTMTQNGVLNTNIVSGPSSIDVDENEIHQAATSAFIFATKNCHVCDQCGNMNQIMPN